MDAVTSVKDEHFYETANGHGLARDPLNSIVAPRPIGWVSTRGQSGALNPALERVNLAEDVDRARLAAEAERLRSALLDSISHDLRTPLASILGSATSLRACRLNLDDAAQDELLVIIQDEAERLNRFIASLLDMTRLDAGAIQPQRDLVNLDDIIGSALKRAGKLLEGHRVALDLAPDLPVLRLDPVLLEQVLFNLLDNAAKYTPPGTEVRLNAWRESGLVRLHVLDESEGIQSTDIERIFDKFYRVRETTRKRAGTGLGLTICRGFVEAMGGTIVAGNRPDRIGSVFAITLPVPAEADPPRATLE
jgi:two-component system, OmpR family, sensor histidine kinase KdpD